MTATLDDRLRRHYADRVTDIPEHGPGLDLTAVRLMTGPTGRHPRRSTRVAIVLGSVAAASVVGVIVHQRAGDDIDPVATTPDISASSLPADSIVPMTTLGPTGISTKAVDPSDIPDITTLSPVTVPEGSALQFWRWFPDLEISERETTAGGTELCWRTPVGTGCIDDTFISPEVGLVPTEGGVIVLARPALIEIVPPPTEPLAPLFEQGPLPTTVTATLSDGTTVSAAIEYGDEFGVGSARITLAGGVTVIQATSG